MTLEEKISQLETELAKVKAELAERKQSVWLPEKGQNYFYINESGFPIADTNKENLYNYSLNKYNNIFKCDNNTFKHLSWYSENVLLVQNKLMQLHELLCPDYFPDWNNGHEDKYSVYFDNNQRIWRSCINVISNPLTVVFTYEAAVKACEILNAEKFMIGDDNG